MRGVLVQTGNRCRLKWMIFSFSSLWRSILLGLGSTFGNVGAAESDFHPMFTFESLHYLLLTLPRFGSCLSVSILFPERVSATLRLCPESGEDLLVTYDSVESFQGCTAPH